MRRNGVVIVASVVSFFVAWAISEWLYQEMVPGIPDAGPVPIGVRPWLFAGYYGMRTLISPRVWVSGKNLTWLFSGLAFAVPVMLACLLRPWWLRYGWIAVLAVAGALIAVAHTYLVHHIFFVMTPYDSADVTRLLFRAWAWVGGFQAFGLFLGTLLQLGTRRRSR